MTTKRKKYTTETHRANAQVSNEIWKKITESSKKLGLSPSSVVRMAIAKGMEQING